MKCVRRKVDNNVSFDLTKPIENVNGNKRKMNEGTNHLNNERSIHLNK